MKKENRHELWELRQMQGLSHECKVLKTEQRIKEWVDFFGVENVYVSFSGGLNSTEMLDIVRKSYPDIEAIFVDTGLEYPEIRKFVRSFNNVRIVYPKMNFAKVIIKYGYPFISKEVCETISQARLNKINGKYAYRLQKVLGIAKDKDGNKSKYNCEKYAPLLDLPIKFSNKCCDIMKKAPLKNISKKPIIATLAAESRLREQGWLKNGCNSFDGKQVSKPMSFWLEQDALQYKVDNNLEICSVYGEVCETNTQGNLMLDGCGSKLTCSGCQRTGCVFCGFGAHLDTRNGGTSRFVRLKQTHPKLYDYCMNGGEFIDGLWQPNKQGLGMRYVIDELNKLYNKTLKDGTVKKFIEY